MMANHRKWMVPSKRVCTALALGITFVVTLNASAQQVILAGSDLWSTPGGGQSWQDFSDNPIPADFFGEGSAAFDGMIVFGGLTLNDNPGLAPPEGTDLGLTDTIVQRMSDVTLDAIGSEATVPIEIVALSLMSTAPITVMINGEPTFWDVEAQLPFPEQTLPGQPSTRPMGDMTIRWTHETGGTYDSMLPVEPVLFFLEVDNPSNFRAIDVEIHPSLQAMFMVMNGQWSMEMGDNDLVTIDNPIQLANGQTILPTTPNFFPGIARHPVTGLPQCKFLTEEAMLARHGVIPAPKALTVDADQDGIVDLCDNCPMTPNATQEDEDNDCVGDVCDNCPMVSNPTQTNSDMDTHGDDCDNCPMADNEDQADADTDGTGDACPPDATGGDGDGTDGNGGGTLTNPCGMMNIMLIPFMLLGLGAVRLRRNRSRRKSS